MDGSGQPIEASKMHHRMPRPRIGGKVPLEPGPPLARPLRPHSITRRTCSKIQSIAEPPADGAVVAFAVYLRHKRFAVIATRVHKEMAVKWASRLIRAHEPQTSFLQALALPQI
ncbi:hypothetical protein GGTG_12563 [Gaeumannomyces tritici R3-111a-1]|uniref:Uncharacterized protein n=1 Tax=Gaeumannomyces tritici (strain R3-111a-1) TaxID=644352 RepID=J3PGD9_GAET3|nr:hypothetical protein GGTG_12563 [Gaeumannomyces tritici R3-111a-1]EJT69680.1 hypothetical protein GGTG_12563 [Gaeumannomyces tritici R3-111a-1]